MEEKTIDIDKSVVDAIAAEVSKSMTVSFEEKEKALEDKIAAIEKANEKEKSKLQGEDEAGSEEVSKYAKLDKYEFAAEQFKAWVNKDSQKLAEMNAEAIKSLVNGKSEVNKATYHNVATTADGGAVVPNNELMNEVFSVLGQYSTIANDLRTVTLTAGEGLDYASLITDVTVTEVNAEGGDKTVTKMTLASGEVVVREFAGIALLTKKLVRQAAIDIFEMLRDSFARAIAEKRAQLALTDADSGIINQTGIEEVVLATGSTDVEDITWANIRAMPWSVPVAAARGAKYYMSRELVAHLDGLEDTQGRSLDLVKLDGDGLSGTLKNGYRFAVEEELGQGAGATHAVFGNAGRYGILLRQGVVEAETFYTGTAVDNSDVSHNLLQQNKIAHRVAFYENVGYPIPGAFATLAVAAS